MGPRRACLVVTIGLASVVFDAPQSGAAAQADCSRAAALAAAGQAGVADPRFPEHVAGALCGAFLGPGSQVMAVKLLGQQCDPNNVWSILRFADEAWQHVPGPWDDGPRIVGITQVGDDIREEQPIFRKSDFGCDHTGGTKARIWHWDGTRLKAGPWKRAEEGTIPRGNPGHFRTPSGNIACVTLLASIDGPASVFCGIKSGLRPAPRRVKCTDGGANDQFVSLGATGRTSVPRCWGDPGPFVGVEKAPVLRYGKTWHDRDLRCTSSRSGLTCRNGDGHGFVLSRTRWRRF